VSHLLRRASGACLLAAATVVASPASPPPDLAALPAALAAYDTYGPFPAPNASTVYLTVRSDRSNRWQWIASVTWRDGSWSAPRPLPFTHPSVSDRDPALAPDGRSLVFTSNRPTGAASPFTLWRSARTDRGWGEPEPVPGLEDVEGAKGPAITAEGVLFFSAPASAQDRADLWTALPDTGGYGTPTRLGGLSSPGLDLDPWVSSSGDLLIFSSDRDSPDGDADLYLARRSGSGWSAPVRLPPSGVGVWDEAPALVPDLGLLLWSRGWGELRVAALATPE